MIPFGLRVTSPHPPKAAQTRSFTQIVAHIDNWSDNDNKLCVDLVHRLLGASNLFGYGEIRDGGYTSSLMGAFTGITDPRFVIVTITEKRDVYPALQKWFSRGGVALG